MKSPLIAITPGDPEGIGPEVVAKALKKNPALAQRSLAFGDPEALRRAGARIFVVSGPLSSATVLSGLRKRPTPRHLLVVPPPATPKTRLGREVISTPGFQSGWAIESAAQAISMGIAKALVTGPISKKRLQDGGYPYSGHTDFLADLCGLPEVTMMLAGPRLRVSLVTTHIPLSRVSESLSHEAITRTLHDTVKGLQTYFGIKKPKVAVMGLNPHAGEEGRIGSEERDVIAPKLVSLRRSMGSQCSIDGPFPSDTFFAKTLRSPRRLRYDAVVCMYHDQGLIPVKLLDFDSTVNITLGLPWIRTSVDHGTAFDIAGKGVANPSSFIAAWKLTQQILRRTS